MECYDEQKEFIEKARLALDSAEVALLRLELAYRASHPPSDEEIAEAQVQRKRLLITRYAKLAETLGDEFKLGPLDEKLESDLVGITSMNRDGMSWYVFLEEFTANATINVRWDEDEPEPESEAEADNMVWNALGEMRIRDDWEAVAFEFAEQSAWYRWRTDGEKPSGVERVYRITAERPLASMADALAVCRWLATAEFKILLPY